MVLVDLEFCVDQSISFPVLYEYSVGVVISVSQCTEVRDGIACKNCCIDSIQLGDDSYLESNGTIFGVVWWLCVTLTC